LKYVEYLPVNRFVQLRYGAVSALLRIVDAKLRPSVILVRKSVNRGHFTRAFVSGLVSILETFVVFVLYAIL